jgi:hypothetical protein
MCPSCAAQANSCEWCISYASLVGARVSLTRAAAAGPGLAAGGDSSSGGARAFCPPSPERRAIVEFFREFSSTVPATWQRVAPPRPVLLAQPLWATRTLTTRSPGAYAQPWEKPWTTPHVRVPHRYQPVDPNVPPRWSALSTVSLRPTNDIRPQRRSRRWARKPVAVAAVGRFRRGRGGPDSA